MSVLHEAACPWCHRGPLHPATHFGRTYWHLGRLRLDIIRETGGGFGLGLFARRFVMANGPRWVLVVRLATLHLLFRRR